MDDKTMGVKERAASTPSNPAMEKAEKEAREVVKEVSKRGKGFLEDRKTILAGQMEALSSALKQTKNELSDPDSQWMERYLERAADSLNRASHKLRERDVDDLMERARRFARNQPAVFIGGAAVIGFAVSRFLRSSDKHEHADYQEDALSSFGERPDETSPRVADSEVSGSFTQKIATNIEEDRHGKF